MNNKNACLGLSAIRVLGTLFQMVPALPYPSHSILQVAELPESVGVVQFLVAPRIIESCL